VLLHVFFESAESLRDLGAQLLALAFSERFGQRGLSRAGGVDRQAEGPLARAGRMAFQTWVISREGPL
jgi:hypothetical protein